MTTRPASKHEPVPSSTLNHTLCGADSAYSRSTAAATEHEGLAWWQLLAAAVCIYLLGSIPGIGGEFTLNKQAIAKIQLEHGEYARRRVVFWQKLMRSGLRLSDTDKLQRVNSFFNELEFVNDDKHWGEHDYWATPLQTLTTNGGDCEDFSIAKYFTLIEMGIPADQLRLTYVKALQLNQAHMVLTYFPSPDAEPLVLDNLDTEIKTASKREDLLPVYSFNGDGLWLAKSRTGNDKHVGKASRLGPWRDVIARINSEYTR
ncbi:MAG: transglutaminase-like cysteine peptidase [Pseudomonadota bacterium]